MIVKMTIEQKKVGTTSNGTQEVNKTNKIKTRNKALNKIGALLKNKEQIMVLAE